MPLRPRLALAVLLAAGCSPSPAIFMLSRPDLSRLAPADTVTMVSPPTCANGFQLTEVPHQPYRMQAVIGSDGTWHVIYPVDYTYDHLDYVGLRYVTSQNPARSESIEWSNGDFDLSIGPDNVPTVFFGDWNGGPQQRPDGVTRARRSNGAWQVDALPIWTGTADNWLAGISSTIDDENHAHVVVFSNAAPSMISDVTGSWVATPLPIVQPLLTEAVNVAVDKAGHEFVSASTFADGQVVFSNVSGAWAQLGSGGLLRRDRAGDVHVLQWGTNLTDLDLTAQSPLRVLDASPLTLMDAAFGMSPNPLVVAYDARPINPIVDVWTDVNGMYQPSVLPMASARMLETMTIGSDGRPRFAMLVATPGVGSANVLGFLDPCP
jgi:hypothetical protein